MRTVAGVDGCRGGWIAVSRGHDPSPLVAVHSTFAGLISALPGDAVIAVDMPIGLPERIEGGGRGPEQVVRKFLGPRQSSVFSVPSRAAVYAETGAFVSVAALHAAHRRASAVALATSEPARKISIQAFGLFPRIREIDTLLTADPALRERVLESHPEAVFAVLNGMVPMDLPKKIKGSVNPAGMAERRALLVGCGLPPSLLVADPPRGAGEDDFLDACAVMLAAERFVRGEALCHPDPPARDSFGLPITIWT